MCELNRSTLLTLLVRPSNSSRPSLLNPQLQCVRVFLSINSLISHIPSAVPDEPRTTANMAAVTQGKWSQDPPKPCDSRSEDCGPPLGASEFFLPCL
ncbi:hypothetical protein FA13DRAFT_1747733 [Coprinellus micaceus]|uniref:Uncharacterized protein n=1 Tax=Coprinellus micaceus TaxID=71717 RepID=A0A4Y7S1N8_COPMI|nr:hypothetical protein FA13DRAFT_1747733 [Coprinellus micaceus]